MTVHIWAIGIKSPSFLAVYHHCRQSGRCHTGASVRPTLFLRAEKLPTATLPSPPCYPEFGFGSRLPQCCTRLRFMGVGALEGFYLLPALQIVLVIGAIGSAQQSVQFPRLALVFGRLPRRIHFFSSLSCALLRTGGIIEGPTENYFPFVPPPALFSLSRQQLLGGSLQFPIEIHYGLRTNRHSVAG